MKKIIKQWLGIDKIEVQLQTNDNDILNIMEKQLRLEMDYPLTSTLIPEEDFKNVKKIKPYRKSRKLHK